MLSSLLRPRPIFVGTDEFPDLEEDDNDDDDEWDVENEKGEVGDIVT